MALHPLDADEPRPSDVLRDAEANLLLELEDLRSEIEARVARVQVVLELLAAMRASIGALR